MQQTFSICSRHTFLSKRPVLSANSKLHGDLSHGFFHACLALTTADLYFANAGTITALAARAVSTQMPGTGCRHVHMERLGTCLRVHATNAFGPDFGLTVWLVSIV